MSFSISTSPRIQRSPFFEATRRYGALGYSVYNKMYLPIGYDDPEKEFWSLVNDVTLWDVAVQRIVEISGPDALAFTNMLTPRDLTKCRTGNCKYVLITDQHGGILNDPILLRLAEDRFWLSRADSDILMWAKGVAVNSGLDINICEPAVATLQIQGPKSVHVVEKLFGPSVLDIKYYDFQEFSLNGAPVILARTGWSAERGYEVYLRDTSKAIEVWDSIMAAGEEYKIVPASPNRIRRIEGGILDFSVDMNEETNPFEIGMDRLVQLDLEDDFIGKFALKAIREAGIKRKLVGVELDGSPVSFNETSWAAKEGDKVIGKLTSCVYSPRLKKNVGFVMTEIAYTQLGTSFSIESVDGPRVATVVPMPFFDPEKSLSKE
ncbi:MAG: glycine cleavage system protein T [Rhodospirillaceae bacterium]|nr:glycine cleavage system protein T [Rhodospirillaceae bacterium]MBL6931324.1 glycine cleavage system protein T [Rhodospirillales bacterium]